MSKTSWMVVTILLAVALSSAIVVNVMGLADSGTTLVPEAKANTQEWNSYIPAYEPGGGGGIFGSGCTVYWYDNGCIVEC